jgi:hypothetical protein
MAVISGRALFSGTPETPWKGAVLVSPGGSGSEGRALTGCPTFSWAPQWSLIQVVESYEPTVFAIGSAPAADPVLRVTLPAGATAWTPEAGSCLAPGRYGWAIGARVGPAEASQMLWSKPALFRVLSGSIRDPGGRERSTAAILLPQAPLPVAAAERPGAGPRNVAGSATFSPSDCTVGQETFSDVPASDPFCRWIEQLARDDITAGCGSGKYCPDGPVTRRQFAVAMERAMRGTLRWGAAANGPRTTTVADPADDVGRFSSIALGVDDLPIISYQDATDGLLLVAHCTDAACTGALKSLVDGPPATGYGTSIVIGSDLLPILSYIDTNGALRVSHCNNIACSGADRTLTTIDASSVFGIETAIAIGADNMPIIAYNDSAAGVLRVAHCNDIYCLGANETITPLDDPANSVGTHVSMAIGTDGFAIISYRDETASALRVAHCNNAACTSATITTVDDSANSLGAFTSIAIGADGLPIISYYDGTAGALKVAHCNDSACAGANELLTVVDNPASDVGLNTSIAIGADNLPIISYVDYSAHGIKVVHCNDAACAGNDETVSAVDYGAHEVGDETSIMIGSDGVAIISYHDITAGALKVVHCGNVTCAP